MYLKALTLRGFKSFATATTLKFEPGITCIVGPNGSGKSNVVDALTWVMGEQGAKSLRGSAMVDVIFAGTAARQPLGRAQVELTIDNSDGRLPIDFSEVTMSRTLFRGGASEYSINQSPARLLDVQELLSDTGMGRQMHVIVGQGQLDAVLNATAQERRSFIDEAAGVLKHRRRKERALRKLETMDQNLVRVLDLTEEMRRQLKPLARQAKAAQKASGVQARIVYAQRRLAALELTEVMAALQWAHGEALGLRGKSTRFDAQLEQLRGELAELGQQLDAQRRNSEILSENWHGLRETVQRFVSLGDLAKERLRRASTVAVPISEASIELARERQAECVKEAEAAEVSWREATEVFQEAELQAKQALEAAQVEAGKLRLAEQELNRLLNQQTRFEAELAQAHSRVQSTQDAVSRSEVRLQEAKARALEAAQVSSAASSSVTQNLDAEAGALTQAHSQAIENENQCRQLVERLTTELREAGEQVATWRARSQVLSEALADPGESDKKRQAKAQEPTWNILGRLGEHITVAKGWEDAVSALLEPYGEAELIESLELSAQIEQLAQVTNQPIRALVVSTEAADGQLGGQLNRQLDERLNGQPTEQIGGQSDRYSSGHPTGYSDGQIGKEVDGLVDREVDGQTNGQTSGQAIGSSIDQMSAQIDEEPIVEQANELAGPLTPQTSGTNSPGRIVAALECVTASTLAAPALKALLEKAFLADSMEAAVKWLQGETDLSVRVAVQTGTVLTACSIRTRGEAGASRLRLRSELEEAKSQATIAAENLQVKEQQLAQARTSLQEAAASAAEKLRLLREVDAQKSEQAKELARVSALATATEQEAERAQIQLEEAKEVALAAKQVEADLEQAALSREKVVPETFLVEARENARRADEAANQWRDNLAEARMQLHAANERLTSAKRQVQAFNTQIEQLLLDRERQISKFEAANTMRLTATKVLEQADEAMNLAKSLAEKAGQERQEANQKVSEISQQVGVVQGRIADLENSRAQLVNERQQAEVEFAQLQYRFEQAKEKALEVVPERESSVEESSRAGAPLEIEETSERLGDSSSASGTSRHHHGLNVGGGDKDGSAVSEQDGHEAGYKGKDQDGNKDGEQDRDKDSQQNRNKDEDKDDKAQIGATDPVDIMELPAELLDLLQDFGPEHFWPVTGNPDTVDTAGEAESAGKAEETSSRGSSDTHNNADGDDSREYSENNAEGLTQQNQAGQEQTEAAQTKQNQIEPDRAKPGRANQSRANQSQQWVPFTREIATEALAGAERELARLGVVNPLAIEEHDALKARHDFLLEQVEDLNRSKADLMKIIREVDQKVRESFQQAFEDVSEQFAHVFSVLFPGGSGRLELTDPDDPLHTGVEIHARPAGKKVTRMSLLSGGERSLASLAYLFAIFKARPSPFYVLDEIEAALDDINLSRVLEVLQELQQDSQLLIVTHQKRTMQIADALYGITMKDGVTTAISHKMRERD